MPPAKIWPYTTQTKWRSDFGERILRTVRGTVPEAACDQFDLFGDHVFCMKVMKRTDAVALSFGIEERDLWSEIMSNKFQLPTRLYDCYVNPATSPPMALKAPNGVGPGGCQGATAHCYETAYEAHRVCLGAIQGELKGRRYTTLAEQLKGRGPLSVYLKIDVEGSEWPVLEALLQSEEDQAKLRTLDMEVHFGSNAVSNGDETWDGSQTSLERETSIL